MPLAEAGGLLAQLDSQATALELPLSLKCAMLSPQKPPTLVRLE